jgi:hypothetical protein
VVGALWLENPVYSHPAFETTRIAKSFLVPVVQKIPLSILDYARNEFSPSAKSGANHIKILKTRRITFYGNYLHLHNPCFVAGRLSMQRVSDDFIDFIQ